VTIKARKRSGAPASSRPVAFSPRRQDAGVTGRQNGGAPNIGR
jgi:hypothetical protein